MFVLTVMMSSTVLVNEKALEITSVVKYPGDLVKVNFLASNGEARDFTYDGKRQTLLVGLSFS